MYTYNENNLNITSYDYQFHSLSTEYNLFEIEKRVINLLEQEYCGELTKNEDKRCVLSNLLLILHVAIRNNRVALYKDNYYLLSEYFITGDVSIRGPT
ncbi:MAG: hypothetical protein ACYDEX_09080 [Mobilitalea sp.]